MHQRGSNQDQTKINAQVWLRLIQNPNLLRVGLTSGLDPYHFTMAEWLDVLDAINVLEFEFEWGFYALSASKAIFRARTYNCITYSVR